MKYAIGSSTAAAEAGTPDWFLAPRSAATGRRPWTAFAPPIATQRELSQEASAAILAAIAC